MPDWLSLTLKSLLIVALALLGSYIVYRLVTLVGEHIPWDEWDDE